MGTGVALRGGPWSRVGRYSGQGGVALEGGPGRGGGLCANFHGLHTVRVQRLLMLTPHVAWRLLLAMPRVAATSNDSPGGGV